MDIIKQATVEIKLDSQGEVETFGNLMAELYARLSELRMNADMQNDEFVGAYTMRQFVDMTNMLDRLGGVG